MMSGVLILSARVGAGVTIPAQPGDPKSIRRNRARRSQCIASKHSTTPTLSFARLYTKAYVDMVNTMPALYGFYYDEREKRAKHELLRPAIPRLNTRPLIKLLEEHQPDITVCTHFMPAEIISWLIPRKEARHSTGHRRNGL